MPDASSDPPGLRPKWTYPASVVKYASSGTCSSLLSIAWYRCAMGQFRDIEPEQVDKLSCASLGTGIAPCGTVRSLPSLFKNQVSVHVAEKPSDPTAIALRISR